MGIDRGARDRAIFDLIHDDGFMLFVQEATRTYEPKEAFLRRPMPFGMDPELMWEFVSFQRLMAGAPSVRELMPIKDRQTELGFSTVTPDMLHTLNDIASRASSSSHLWKTLGESSESPEILRFLIEELAAASTRDGLGVDHESVHALVLEQRAPIGEGEVILANALTLMRDLPCFANEPLDAPLVAHFHARIIEGTDAKPQAYRPPKTLVADRYPHASEEEMLASIEETYAQAQRRTTHPLLSALFGSDLFWETPPFASCNGITEVLVRRLSLMKADMPALAYVPLSKLRLDWELGLVSTPTTAFKYGEALVLSTYGTDSTPYYQQIIRFIDQGLVSLENAADKLERENARKRRLVNEDGRLTLRQKQVLCALIDQPNNPVDVDSHSKQFDIAPSTARADLNRLVSLGYLSTEYRGKKQVFEGRAF